MAEFKKSEQPKNENRRFKKKKQNRKRVIWSKLSLSKIYINDECKLNKKKKWN